MYVTIMFMVSTILNTRDAWVFQVRTYRILAKKGGAFYSCSVPVFIRLKIARNNYSSCVSYNIYSNSVSVYESKIKNFY